MTAESANDYAISISHTAELRRIVSEPADARRQALKELAVQLGHDSFVDLFAQFIGLANQVADNAREHAQAMLVTEGGVHPYTAEKINMPSLVGALQGVQLADGIDTASLCHGCAFRLGSIANTCDPTTSDADWCSQPNERPFMCHAYMDAAGEPTQACKGFAQRRRAMIAGERFDSLDCSRNFSGSSCLE